MAYSIEVRTKALEDFVNGHSDEQVSAKHGVSTYTLNNWKKLLLATGSLEKKKVKRKSGKPYKHTPEKIGSLLDKSKSDRATSDHHNRVFWADAKEADAAQHLPEGDEQHCINGIQII